MFRLQVISDRTSGDGLSAQSVRAHATGIRYMRTTTLLFSFLPLSALADQECISFFEKYNQENLLNKCQLFME